MDDELKKFIDMAIKDYANNNKVDKYVKLIEVSSDQDYSNFTQIYHCFNVGQNIMPYIHGLGNSIAMGELQLLTVRLLRQRGTHKESIKKSELSPSVLTRWVGYNTVFIIPVDLFFEKFLKSQNFYPFITWKNTDIFFAGTYPIVEISEKFVKEITNKIIAFDRDSVWWKFVKLPESERLNIYKEKSSSGDSILIIRTIDDVYISDPSSVKIIDVIDQE